MPKQIQSVFGAILLTMSAAVSATPVPTSVGVLAETFTMNCAKTTNGACQPRNTDPANPLASGNYTYNSISASSTINDARGTAWAYGEANFTSYLPTLHAFAQSKSSYAPDYSSLAGTLYRAGTPNIYYTGEGSSYADATVWAVQGYQYTGATPFHLTVTATLDSIFSQDSQNGKLGYSSFEITIFDAAGYVFDPQARHQDMSLTTCAIITYPLGYCPPVPTKFDNDGGFLTNTGALTKTIEHIVNPGDRFFIGAMLDAGACCGITADSSHTLNMAFNDYSQLDSIAVPGVLPEPGSVLLMGAGLAAIAVRRRRLPALTLGAILLVAATAASATPTPTTVGVYASTGTVNCAKTSDGDCRWRVPSSGIYETAGDFTSTPLSASSTVTDVRGTASAWGEANLNSYLPTLHTYARSNGNFAPDYSSLAGSRFRPGSSITYTGAGASVADANIWAVQGYQYTGEAPFELTITATLDSVFSADGQLAKVGHSAFLINMFDSEGFFFDPFGPGADLTSCAIMNSQAWGCPPIPASFGSTRGMLTDTGTLSLTVSHTFNPGDKFFVGVFLDASVCCGEMVDSSHTLNLMFNDFTQLESIDVPGVLPEPASLPLSLTGLALLVAVCRRTNGRANSAPVAGDRRSAPRRRRVPS